jgi:hypothetical protein
VTTNNTIRTRREEGRETPINPSIIVPIRYYVMGWIVTTIDISIAPAMVGGCAPDDV